MAVGVVDVTISAKGEPRSTVPLKCAVWLGWVAETLLDEAEELLEVEAVMDPPIGEPMLTLESERLLVVVTTIVVAVGVALKMVLAEKFVADVIPACTELVLVEDEGRKPPPIGNPSSFGMAVFELIELLLKAEDVLVPVMLTVDIERDVALMSVDVVEDVRDCVQVMVPLVPDVGQGSPEPSSSSQGSSSSSSSS